MVEWSKKVEERRGENIEFKHYLTIFMYPNGELAPTAPWTWGDVGSDPNWMGALPFITYMTSLYHNGIHLSHLSSHLSPMQFY